MDKIENLATEIFDFYKDLDPYGCADAMESDETEDDAVAKLAEQLSDQRGRENILKELCIVFEEMLSEQPLYKKAYDIIKKFETINL